MKSKLIEKEKAIELRRKGLSYSEILKVVSVSQSSLSSWLKEIHLTKNQMNHLKEKQIAGQKEGGERRKIMRIKDTLSIYREAQLYCKKLKLNKSLLWIAGVMLYWAEGTKQKPHSISHRLAFSNSDPNMIKLYLLWLRKILNICNDRISIGLYIHDNSRNRLESVVSYWSRVTGFPETKFDRIYFKKHKIVTNRKNIGDNYYGLLKIDVNKSTNINRLVFGWTNEILKKWGVV